MTNSISKKARLGITTDLLNTDGTLTFPNYPLERLRQHERLTLQHIELTQGKFSSAVGELDLLISVPHGAPLDETALRNLRSLVAVIRVGVGFDDCDVKAFDNAGVALVIPAIVTQRPTAVAALTLILALATRLLDKHDLTKAGPKAWEMRANLRGTDLRGKLLGLVGCGSIGRELITIARPLGLSFAVYDPNLDSFSISSLGARALSLEELLSQSDFVSIHCPLNAQTKHLIGASRLALMSPSSYIINTARGGIIDQQALMQALRTRSIAGAGLDVFEDEPPLLGDELLKSDNVVLSAHALNWTKELDAELGNANLEAIEALLRGEIPQTIVNPSVVKDERYRAKLARISIC